MSGGNTIETISGNIVDVLNSRIYPATLEISNERIIRIIEEKRDYNTFIIPGFVDSHVHIESSMLPPSEFARLAVRHGTVATVSDPHEIANVMGMEGVNYMLEDAGRVPLKIYFGMPSCVPATPHETSGGRINLADVETLFRSGRIRLLSEVMNFKGILSNDPEIMEKVSLARRYGLVIDGHAPDLRGEELKRYVMAGISTDHEGIHIDEAREKLKLGMKIQIREGSEARNFDALSPLINDYPDDCMFCCDDILPHDLAVRHIDELVRRAIGQGMDEMKVLRCACVNPVLHYQLNVGLLREGDYADFLEVDNLHDLNILRTFINGEVVALRGKALFSRQRAKIVNNFNIQKKYVTEFHVRARVGKINVIEVVDGQLLTKRLHLVPRVLNGRVVSDPERDILKIAVVNRYLDSPPAIGFVKNLGLKKGAIASSVAHDSHNIVAAGVKDEDICRAVNLIIENKGGVAVVYNDVEEVLPLPIAGIMSDMDGFEVAGRFSMMRGLVRRLGSELKAPFMNLSFIPLLVIPEIKLGDRGLFDVEAGKMIDLFEVCGGG
jgi:adenine deaminase